MLTGLKYYERLQLCLRENWKRQNLWNNCVGLRTVIRLR